jgi:hypothetical protein
MTLAKTECHCPQCGKLKLKRDGSPHKCVPPGSASPLDLALAACRAITFAAKQAERHRGEYSLTDLRAAETLAREALTAGR